MPLLSAHDRSQYDASHFFPFSTMGLKASSKSSFVYVFAAVWFLKRVSWTPSKTLLITGPFLADYSVSCRTTCSMSSWVAGTWRLHFIIVLSNPSQLPPPSPRALTHRRPSPRSFSLYLSSCKARISAVGILALRYSHHRGCYMSQLPCGPFCPRFLKCRSS